MFHFLKFSAVTLLVLALAACGSDNNDDGSSTPNTNVQPTEEQGQTNESDGSKTYSFELNPLTTGEKYRKINLLVSEPVEQNQKTTLLANFNSGKATKFQVLNQEVHGCESPGELSFRLLNVDGEEPQVAVDDMVPTIGYKIEPNTKYAYEVVRAPGSKCEKLELSMRPWLDDYAHDPAFARSCLYKSDNGDLVTQLHYFAMLDPLKVQLGTGKTLIGPKTLCGQDIVSAGTTYDWDEKTMSVIGNTRTESGDTYSYKIEFAKDGRTGELTCYKNNDVIQAGELIRCQDKVMDLRQFFGL